MRISLNESLESKYFTEALDENFPGKHFYYVDITNWGNTAQDDPCAYYAVCLDEEHAEDLDELASIKICNGKIYVELGDFRMMQKEYNSIDEFENDLMAISK